MAADIIYCRTCNSTYYLKQFMIKTVIPDGLLAVSNIE